MNANFRWPFFSSFFCIVFLALTIGLHAQNDFDFANDQQAYVIMQLPSLQFANYDSLTEVKGRRMWVDGINRLNEKMGYAKLEKKIASFELRQGDMYTPYMTVRKFEDLEEAEQYAQKLDLHIEGLILGDIKEPFPISSANLKLCMEAKDFFAYYKLYKTR